MSGRLEAIWRKRAHRGVMDAVQEAELVEGQGVSGSVGRSTRRQVTVIEHEVWARVMGELTANVDPSARRANLMISGIRLEETRGQLLRIGATLLKIGGHTTPCERMDEALPGLQEALRAHWGGGAFAQVVTGGIIRIGDTVTWEPLAPSETR